MSAAQELLDLFANRYDCFMQQKDDGSYFKRTEPLTLDVLKQHLAQQITLSIPAISQGQTCKWLSWDIDTNSTISLSKIKSLCTYTGLTALSESRRTDRIGHIWVFFDPPLAATEACHFLKLSRIFCDLTPDIKCDLFPSHSVLPPGGYGTGLRMPFGLHRKLLPELFVGLFADCPDIDLNRQIRWLLAQKRNDPSIVVAYNNRAPALYKKSESGQGLGKNTNLEFIPADYPLRACGNEFIGPCPACRENGHDTKGNNLSINKRNHLVYCHYNSGDHSIKEIKQAFLNLRVAK